MSAPSPPRDPLDGSARPLALGLVISLAAHAIVILPLLLAVMTARPEPPAFRAQLRQADAPLEASEPQQQLGIERSDASSLTWIGYDTYVEHLARRAAYEQAAFTAADQPAQASAERAAPAPDPAASPAADAIAASEAAEAPAPDASEPAPDARDAERSAAAGAPDDPAATGPPAPQQIPSGAAGAVPADTPAALAPSGDENPLVPVADPADPGPMPRGAADATEPDAAAPDPREIASLVARLLRQVQHGRGAAAVAALATEAERPAPPRDDGSPGAAASNKDSDPTSTVDVPIDEIKAGQPIAAEGLELAPQRPEFPMVVKLTASPCNPLVVLHFKRDGRPLLCEIIETSCDSRVDTALLSSLYRWRASGAPLEQLEGDETIGVRIRIVLTRR